MEDKRFLKTRTEIVQHLGLNHDAISDDVKMLRSWELGKIDTSEAIRQLIRHNNMTDKVTGIAEEAFHEFARKLGYIRNNG